MIQSGEEGFLVVNVSESLWQGCFIKMLMFLS